MEERLLKWLYDIKLAIDEIESYFENESKIFSIYHTARKTRSLQGRDIRAQRFLKLNNDILRYMSLSTSNCLQNQWDILTAGQAGLACVNANRIGGRQQEPEGTREEVLTLAL